MSDHKKEIRAKRNYLAQSNRNYGQYLTKVPRVMWPEDLRATKVESVWRSKHYLVQVYPETLGAVRLSICRTAINSDGQWKDNITWDELQDLKGQCGFGAWNAVEIYPADIDVVNVANMRHLWVMKDIVLPFVWRSNFEKGE